MAHMELNQWDPLGEEVGLEKHTIPHKKKTFMREKLQVETTQPTLNIMFDVPTSGSHFAVL